MIHSSYKVPSKREHSSISIGTKYVILKHLQLNKYETTPNFIQSNQNLTSDCLLPVLAWCDQQIVLSWSAEQFYDHIMQELVKTGKFTKSTNNQMSSFGLIV